MRRSVPRLLVVLALAVGSVPGCHTVTSEDRLIIQACLENAAQYYDGGHYLRAFQQWGRALELDPYEDRAKLGQGMALYQLGREVSKDSLRYLTEAEMRLAELRGGALGDQGWKAELGFALVEVRWAELYDRALRIHEARLARGEPVDPVKVEEAKRERLRRAQLAEDAFRTVLDDERTEPNLKLTCWLGLARTAAMRGALEESLDWCRKFEKQVVASRDFWKKQGEAYSGKLFGAEIQEAELRDVLANTLFKLGRMDEAEAELDRLVAIQPARASAWANRGGIRELRGSWDLARSDYAKFLQLTNLPADDPAVLEVEKRRLLCEERLENANRAIERELPPAR